MPQAVNITIQRSRCGTIRWMAVCLEIVQRHDLETGAIRTDLETRACLVEDVHYIVISGLYVGGRMSDARRSRHIVVIATVLPVRKNIKDDSFAHLHDVTIFALAVWQRRISPLRENEAMTVF